MRGRLLFSCLRNFVAIRHDACWWFYIYFEIYWMQLYFLLLWNFVLTRGNASCCFLCLIVKCWLCIYYEITGGQLLFSCLRNFVTLRHDGCWWFYIYSEIYWMQLFHFNCLLQIFWQWEMFVAFYVLVYTKFISSAIVAVILCDFVGLWYVRE